MTLEREFTRAIKIRVGNQSSWPAPPVEWIGHAGEIRSVIYSPNGARVVTGSGDKTIRIWDPESGAIVGEPLTGHNEGVTSVAYSPDGRHIISGSDDSTIRTWDAETGAPVGDPLEGHIDWVRSVAYSPDGRHIISGSEDYTIRIWDADTGAPVGDPLEGHTNSVGSVAYSPDGRHIVSGSDDGTIRTWDAEALTTAQYPSIQPSPCNPTYYRFYAKSNKDGWVKDSEGGLLYWVPHDCRPRVHSPAVMTIPLTSRTGPVSLDFDDFAFGTSWSQIFKRAPS